MSVKSLIELIAAATTVAELTGFNDESLSPKEQKALLARMRELMTTPTWKGGPTHGKRVGDNYILRSAFGPVKPASDGKGLVPCEATDPAICGRLAVVYGFGFEQRDRGLNIKPLTDFMRRAQPGADGKRQLQAIDYSWAVGSWCLLADWKMAGVGPTVSRTFYGFIGDAPSQFSSSPSYNVRVQPADVLVEGQLRMMVESAIASIWGHNGDLPVFGDAPSATETAKTVARVGAFGLSTERAGTGPRFVGPDGKPVEAETVNSAVGIKRTQQAPSMGASLRDRAAAMREELMAKRAAQSREIDDAKESNG